MSAPTFMPGPWFVVGSALFSKTGPTSRLRIANFVSYLTATLHKQQAANARLIAAAPDLYIALRDLLDNPNSTEAQVRAAKALAEVEGRVK